MVGAVSGSPQWPSDAAVLGGVTQLHTYWESGVVLSPACEFRMLPT